MGWFWADPVAAPSSRPTAPHPLPKLADLEPPPGCPMHKAPSDAIPPPPPPPSTTPYNTLPTNTTEPVATPSYISKLNPLNYMPASISNTREYASDQKDVHLPLDREASTIPRDASAGGGTWEYPSPQQMYNAMLRKGYTDTPAEHVEAMVAVHNFLNEGAWEEIREWERRFGAGLGKGWDLCRRGEEGAARLAALEEERGAAGPPEPTLLRFMGRPDDLTPKARMLSFMAKLYPSKYPDNPPFDRHDWFVQRQSPSGSPKEVRYVIDYYSGPPEENGEPVFYLDVRPAVDGPVAACERAMRWGGDVWYRASGGSVREEVARLKERSEVRR